MVQEIFIQVAIPVPMRQLFTYLVPQELLANKINVGERVIVNFANRQVIGIVMSIDNMTELTPEKIKAIISRVDSKTVLPAALIKLLNLCADYYLHPIGDVVQQALPVLLRQIEQPNLTPPKYWQATNIDEEKQQKELKKIIKRAPKQHSLYQLISGHSKLTWIELRTLGYSKDQLSSLAKKELINEVAQEPTPFEWSEQCINQANKLKLSTEQAVIVSAIQQSLNNFSCHLIDGVTGSGKTEVYLQVIEQVLMSNRQVLVLVPEIGLTPQTLSRFEQRFNVPIFLHHSGLNNKERLATWQSAHKDHAAIIIGTRSSVFTPLAKLGGIIVDEEHDSSFKQQDSFRYNGRDVAIIRAKQLDIPILLGSATPSIESLQNALAKKYHYHQLTKRAGNSSHAKISLINVSQENMTFGLSNRLIQEMTCTLARGEQVLVFLNRRGFAPAISCEQCHWIDNCQRCDRPYTLHRSQGLLICHHCSSQKRIPNQCPNCSSTQIKPMGQGTEQVEQYLTDNFDNYSTVRIDRDSTSRKGELAKRLQEVSDKKHQILIGTQMLAKGHHFPDVTLVAMLDVDGALFSYDFRAAEHMAQLLVQVAGRAGRASKPGKVLVQTNFPEHPLLQDLVNNGYQHFAQQELSQRQQHCLPPFAFQTLVRAEANYPSYPEKFLRQLNQFSYRQCQLIGPMPAAMEKKAGKYRYHLIIQAKTRQHLHLAMRQLLENINQNDWKNKVRWSIDIDPVDLTW